MKIEITGKGGLRKINYLLYYHLECLKIRLYRRVVNYGTKIRY